jgi:hypothetical protein
MFYPKGVITKTFLTMSLGCDLSFHPAKMLAGTITWTIADGTFMAGGAAVSGSLQYDATSNTFSGVDIVVGDDATPLFVPGPVVGDTYTTSDLVADSTSIFLDLADSHTDTGLNSTSSIR